MLKEKLRKLFAKYKGVIKLDLVERGGKTFIEFFRGDGEWIVELTFGIVNEILNDDCSVNADAFFRSIITELLNAHGISSDGKSPPCRIIENFNDISFEFINNNKINTIVGKSEREILFINGESKSGKTVLLKQCCRSHWRDDKIFWVDFNGGYIDFAELIRDLISNQYDSIRIVLDNLECCSDDNAKNILQFFKKFIQKIQGTECYVQLIVLQDSDKKIESSHSGNCEDIVITYSDTRKTILLQKTHNDPSRMTVSDENEIEYFYDKSGFVRSLENLSDDPDAKILLFKVALLSCYGLHTSVPVGDNAAKKLLDNISSIKLFYDGKIMFYPEFISVEILKEFKNFWSDQKHGFAHVFENRPFETVCEDILLKFYREEINISNLEKLLANTAFAFDSKFLGNNNVDEDEKIRDFYELLFLAKEYLIGIETELSNGKMFENHLGAILFAAEALAVYADNDWAAMQAWKKIAAYVRGEYYIDGQKPLPEIWHNKEHLEKTVLDFRNGKNTNSIENQIKLQNELLFRVYGKQYYEAIDMISEKDADVGNIDDIDFSYCLSEIQKTERGEIDINKFFGTYILALLFEFEVTAPKAQRDQGRIKKLWDKIQKSILYGETSDKSKKRKYAYFYPARVPWVTARMLLALQMAVKNNCIKGLTAYHSNIVDLKRDMLAYLEECSIPVKIDGENYRIWASGTGKWNSVLETTIMTTIAISECDRDNAIVKEGLKYINSRGAKLFDKAIADGIWAFETKINDYLNPGNVLENVSELRKELNSLFKNGREKDEEKNDRSLGDTHIAKTLISIVDKFVSRKPDIFSSKKEEIIDLNKKLKVFISFKTDNGCLIAKTLFTELIDYSGGEVFLPYNYTYKMSSGNWPNQLRNAIRQADKYILVVTENSLLSEGVLDEISQIIELGKQDKVIPIIYKCCVKDEIEKIENAMYETKSVKFTSEALDTLKEVLDDKRFNIVIFDEANTDQSINKVIGYLKNDKPFA